MAASQCWKRIGIWGDESPRCQELDRLIHCRNCEVYATAGRGLLERAIPDDYRDEWTAALALTKDTERSDQRSVLVFRLGDEWFGISTSAFREVSDLNVGILFSQDEVTPSRNRISSMPLRLVECEDRDGSKLSPSLGWAPGGLSDPLALCSELQLFAAGHCGCEDHWVHEAVPNKIQKEHMQQ